MHITVTIKKTTHLKSSRLLTFLWEEEPPWLKVPVWITEPGAYLADWTRPFLHLPFDSNHLRMSRYDMFCDAAKAHLELGVPATKSFRQAVEETYEWYLSRGII